MLDKVTPGDIARLRDENDNLANELNNEGNHISVYDNEIDYDYFVP